MQVTPIQFMDNGDRCLWDAKGNARVMRADYSANDNSRAWARLCTLMRDTDRVIAQAEAKRGQS